MDKLRQDYQDAMNTLKLFLDATDVKMTAPVQVSFLNVRAFVQDVEVRRRSPGAPAAGSHHAACPTSLQEIKQKVPAMEAACRAAGRTAQLLSKDAPQEELLQMTAVMASIKEQLSKVCA